MSAILPPQYLERAEATIREATRAANLPLNRPELVPNTHLAHEAGLFADEHGQGDAFHQATLRAYFGEARDVGKPEVLADIGQALGLDRQALLNALESGRYVAEVDHQIRQAQRQGVSSVPSFVFDQRVGFAGAQPYELFQRAMDAVIR